MISVIICSKSPTLLKAVSASILETIGVPFEIIGIENGDRKYGICQAYNIGAAKAKYDIFCFSHEDILFVTQNWGENVIRHLQDKSVGLIGVLGGGPILMVPSIHAKDTMKAESNCIFVDVNSGVKTSYFATATPENNALIKETTGVDGTLMITRRDIYDEFQFDDITLTDFHGYDVDYSIQIQSKYKVCVVFDVLLEHYFKGGANKAYITELLKLSHKWKDKFPIIHANAPETNYTHLHWIAMVNFINFLFKLNYSWGFILKQYSFLSFNRFFKLRYFLSVIKNVLFPKFFKYLIKSIIISPSQENPLPLKVEKS
ncbi:MAG: hypothetical protein H7Y07_02705 [Pyrinomonadaceae bacterium]|nr:hypothetical protein [Sphingobacteriaceae bacterium]